jgi:hypothetical protein
MNNNTQFTLYYLLILICFNSHNSYAKSEQYPNLAGKVLFETRADRITSDQKQGVPANNGYLNFEPNFSLNVNQNWSVKTNWKIRPIRKVNERNEIYPERTVTFLQSDRGYNVDNTGLIVEELKAYFENEDMKFFAGKYNPSFAVAYRKSKRIGVFGNDFTRNYELREKIGAGISALLDDSEISFNSFFNDATDLSRSAVTDRGRARRADGIAGNSSTLSSYSATVEGEKLFGVDELFYNFGYRSLAVEKTDDSAREIGYVGSLEYSLQAGNNGIIIPFVEIANINNFTGRDGRNAVYTTLSLTGKYSNWTTSVATVFRKIKNNISGADSNDHQFQTSVGYKFNDNITLDVSRMNLKEDGSKAVVFGALLSYVYQF